MGGARAPPAPPWLRYCVLRLTGISYYFPSNGSEYLCSNNEEFEQHILKFFRLVTVTSQSSFVPEFGTVLLE